MDKINGLFYIPCTSQLVVPFLSSTYFMSTISLTRYVPDNEQTEGVEGAVHELISLLIRHSQ